MTFKSFFGFQILMFLAGWSTQADAAFSGSNLSFPYDDNVLYNFWKNHENVVEQEDPDASEQKVRAGCNFEYGFEGKGRNGDKTKVNIARLYSSNESYLHSMDESVDPEVMTFELEKFFQPPLLFTDSNGEVLEYQLTAKKTQSDFNFWASVDTPKNRYGQLNLALYCPIKIVKVGLTAELTPLPEAMQEALDGFPALKTEVSNLPKMSFLNLGGLRLDRWNNDRPWGDLHLMLSWNKTLDFKQLKFDWINLFAQVGISAPTADPRDQQSALSIPRGNDNALGVPVSVSVNTFLKKQFRACAAADFLFLTSETSKRRLRKTAEQTELLISDKVKSKRNPGMIYRFTTLLELKTKDQIYSALLAWQYLHKKKDTFSEFATPGYSQNIVNSSERWQKKNFQNIVVQIGMDFKHLTKAEIAPRISACYKLPVTGRRVEMYHSIGINVGLDF